MNPKLLLLLTFLISSSLWAQNPFGSIGKEAEILSLSQGRYPEVFNNDSLRKIGSVVFNTKTQQVVAFIETDTVRGESDLRPDLVSRWLSTDPLAAKYPELSPYNFVGNMPIAAVDPDGQDIYLIIWYTKDEDEDVGHAAVAVDNYKVVMKEVLDNAGNVI